jgi:hypothetical protein
MLVEPFGHPSVFSTSREAIFLQNKLPLYKNYHDITNLYPTSRKDVTELGEKKAKSITP